MEVKLKKKVLYINGVERLFMCDPQRDKLSDVLRRIGHFRRTDALALSFL